MAMACSGLAGEQTTLPVAFRGDTLLINEQETRMGAAQWEAPEKNWGTVGELLKTALPPANAQGLRPDATIDVTLDEAVPWGGLKCVLMAASALGVPVARVQLPDKRIVPLKLPGAEAKGQVVDLPLFAGKGMAQTENGGRKMNCSPGLLKGLVKQLPKATVQVKAGPKLPATQVVGVLKGLGDAKAAAVAYLPVKEITPKEMADRKESKDAVDRAFGGLGRALGGKKKE
jgi:hypothetical protein